MTGTSTGDSGNSQSIREFLYLDFPKLSSYFAQLNRGLTTEIQSTVGHASRDATTSPTTEVGLSGTVGAQAGEAAEASIKAMLAKLLGVTVRLEAAVNGAVRSGSDQFELAEERREVATIQLHHAAFEMVMRSLRDAGLVVDDPTIAAGRFLTFSGYADFVDFDDLAANVKDFHNLGDKFSKVTKQQNFAKGVQKPGDLAYLISKFYAGRIGLLATANGHHVSAYLHPDHLTAPIGFILDNYGRRSQVPITVFGLKIGRSYPKAERAGQASFLDELRKTEADPPGMMGAMLSNSRALEGMDRFFRVRGDAHIYPLAVYVDLPLAPVFDYDPPDTWEPEEEEPTADLAEAN